MCLTSALPKILTEVETFGERCLVDGATNIVSAFIFQALFFLEAPGSLKIVGAVVVLVSVFFIGGSKLRTHRKEKSLKS